MKCYLLFLVTRCRYLVAGILILLVNIAFAALPTLNDEYGNSRTVDRQGQFGQSQSQFSGGISLDSHVFSQNLKVAVNQELDLEAQIAPDAHVAGQVVDLLFVIGLEASAPFDGGIDTEYFALDAQGHKKFVNLYAAAEVWMAQLAEPFKTNVTLDKTVSFELGQLQFSAKAVFYIFVGYRTEQGIITYNPRPIIVDTTASAIAQPLPVNHEDSIVYTPPKSVVTPEPPPVQNHTLLPMRFTPVTHTTENTDIISNSVVLKGLSEESAVAVSGGSAVLIVNGQETSTATVRSGDVLAIKTRSPSAGNTTTLTVTVGQQQAQWQITSAAPVQPSPVAGKMSGYTPVECEVSESGGAVCQLPMTAPAGTGGIAPKLSLGYSSQGNNGPVGVGWSLNGLSAITRCRATQAQDGLIDAVDFDANDRFCLDGERLIAVQGEYGAEGTVYYTEQHTFQKVVSFLNPETKMPRFKAWTKTGLILEYGFTPDSSVEAQGRKDVLIWAVNKILDTKGNYLTVSYEENNEAGDYYPKRIDYTGNDTAGLSPYASVQFFYYEQESL